MGERPFYTVKQTAQLLAIREHSVLTLIRKGELRAIDVSMTPGGKPRWRILPDDLDAFILRRTHEASPVRYRRRNKPKTNVKQYF